MYDLIAIIYRLTLIVFAVLFINLYNNELGEKLMKEKNNIKQALEVHSLLKLYHLTIKQNLKRLEKEINWLDTSDPAMFRQVQNEDSYIKDTVKELAETLETIFLKTRHTLSQLPLDTIVQERLETLGVNFQKDIETSEDYNNAVIALKAKFQNEVN